MSEHDAETFEHAGVPVRIVYDEYPDDPRGWRDSLTTYVWADKEHVAQKHDEQIDLDRFDYRESSWTPVALAARWLTLCDWPIKVIAVPFRIDDYGSNGSRAYLTDINDDRCTGFITVGKKELEEESSPGWDVMEYIKAEFGEFAAWVEGDVYGFIIEPSEEGDDGDSCFGFYGDLDYVRSQARESAEHIAKERFINTEPLDMAEVLAQIQDTKTPREEA